MIGTTIAWVSGLIVGVFLLSRRLSGRVRVVARWQGAALLAWSVGHLLGEFGNQPARWLADLLTVGSTLTLLMAFRALPEPYLRFPGWKNRLDALILVALGASFTLHSAAHLLGAHLSWLHLSANLYLGLAAFSAEYAVRKVYKSPRRLWFYGWSLFLLADTCLVLSPAWLWSLLMLSAFAMIAAEARGATGEQRHEDLVKLVDGYKRAEVRSLDKTLISVFILWYGGILLFMIYRVPEAPVIMWPALLLLLVRWIATGYEGRRSTLRLLQRLRQLELQYDVYTREMRTKNRELSRLLTLKQGYERLLMKSNQQNMKDVSYENVHQMIEEIVDAWYTTIPSLTFLRLSLQSAHGSVYYEVCRGHPGEPANEQGSVRVRVVADEERDTPLSPRYVVVEAATPGDEGGEPDTDSFYQLLAMHVRGLLQRCLQNQQAMELRLVAQEMEMASKIQFSLVPREPLTVPGVRAKALYIPAAYVGGDYVDFVTLDEQHTCFLVADISGHGIPASMLTTGLRSAVRAVIQTCISPDEILSRLNRLLYDDLSKTRSFVTMFVAVYDSQKRILRTSRAGHPEPFYLSSTRQMLLPCNSGPGLGLTRHSTYPLDRFEVDEDFLLLIYTDGLLQLRRHQGDSGALSWLERFHRAALDSGGDTDPMDAIEQCIWEVKQSGQQDDDISVLILDVTVR